jgi:hypothetical protein
MIQIILIIPLFICSIYLLSDIIFYILFGIDDTIFISKFFKPKDRKSELKRRKFIIINSLQSPGSPIQAHNLALELEKIEQEIKKNRRK